VRTILLKVIANLRAVYPYGGLYSCLTLQGDLCEIMSFNYSVQSYSVKPLTVWPTVWKENLTPHYLTELPAIRCKSVVNNLY